MRSRKMAVVLAWAWLLVLTPAVARAAEPAPAAAEPITATNVTSPTIVTASQIADQVVSDLAGRQTELFAWYPDNWGQGGIYFLLGMAGALVTVYLFLGEMLPSMGGQVEYERTRVTLEHYLEQREELINLRNDVALGQADDDVNSAVLDRLSDDLNGITELLETRLRSERWRLFFLGFPIYLVLGGFFAAAVATNFLEALVIGFGWTLIADRLGLERKNAQLQVLREKQVNELKDQIKEYQADLRQAEKERDMKQDELESNSEKLDQSARLLDQYAQEKVAKQRAEANLRMIQQAAAVLPDKLDPLLEQVRQVSATQVADEFEKPINELLDVINHSLSV